MITRQLIPVETTAVFWRERIRRKGVCCLYVLPSHFINQVFRKIGKRPSLHRRNGQRKVGFDQALIEQVAVVEDLILRLTELTRTKAADETEIEVLTIIGILKDSPYPRVAAAFASFSEAWSGKQSELTSNNYFLGRCFPSDF